MWKVFLGIALAACACDGKRGEPSKPSLDTIDRSCKQDLECQLTGTLECCDTSCGERVGEAVSVKAWMHVNEGRQGRASRCQGIECPSVMCPPQPDCRDEARAVCKTGRCEVEVRRTDACAKR